MELDKIKKPKLFTFKEYLINKIKIKSNSECHRYGIISGCDYFCPVFNDGGCEVEDPESMSELIKDCDQSYINEIKRLYPHIIEFQRL